MELKVLNCEIMFVPIFNNLNTLPYCLVKLCNLICLDVYTITTKVHLNLMHVHAYV
jgi:ATP-dependent Lon protease